MKKQIENWEIEFDKKFTPHNPNIEVFGWSKQDMNGAEQIKYFIRNQIQKAQQDYKEKIKDSIAGEIIVAISEGQPTSRLTSLNNNL